MIRMRHEAHAELEIADCGWVPFGMHNETTENRQEIGHIV